MDKMSVVSAFAGWHVKMLKQLARVFPTLSAHLEHVVSWYNQWGIREALKIKQRLDKTQEGTLNKDALAVPVVQVQVGHGHVYTRNPTKLNKVATQITFHVATLAVLDEMIMPHKIDRSTLVERAVQYWLMKEYPLVQLPNWFR